MKRENFGDKLPDDAEYQRIPDHGAQCRLVSSVRLRALKLDPVILRRNDPAGSFLWVLSTAFLVWEALVPLELQSQH